MDSEINKAIVHRFFDELWNNRNLAVADSIFAPDCITHQLRSGADDTPVPRPPDNIKGHIKDWIAAFPDIRFSVEQMIAEGDRVLTHCIASGTHAGTWLGIPATRKLITMQMIVIHRISAGRIVEDWVLVDSLGIFEQLGIVKPRAELLADAAKTATEKNSAE